MVDPSEARRAAPTSASGGGGGIWFPVGVFVVARAILLSCSWVGMTFWKDLFVYAERRNAYLKDWPMLDGLCRWDCGWFVQIAKQGFVNVVDAQVFPLLPLSAGALSRITGLPPELAVLLIANLASLGSFIVIYRLFCDLGGQAAARRGLILFAAFPFAFFHAAGYADSLMVFGSALALWLAHRGRHVGAGAALALGALARHISLFAGVGLLFAQIRERGLHPRRFLQSPAVLGLALPLVALAAWTFFLKHRFGSWDVLDAARKQAWSGMAYWGVADVVRHVPFAKHPEYYFYMAFAALPLAGTLGLLWRPAWRVLGAAAATLMVVSLLYGGIGLGRYAGTCWPAFLPLGAWLAARPHAAEAVTAALIFFQAFFFMLHAHQFPIL